MSASRTDPPPSGDGGAPKRSSRRWWVWLLALLVMAGAVIGLRRFPWMTTLTALANSDWRFLLAALAVNLVSPLAKGWAWHLLLRSSAPSRWRVAQAANLIGTAVNSLSISVVGEAVRARYVVDRDKAPLGLVTASIVWTRAVEALGLALLILAAPAFMSLPPLVRWLPAAAGAALLIALALAAGFRRLPPLPSLTPGAIRAAIRVLAEVGSPRRLIAPTLLALVNWAAQWATFHLTLRTVGLDLSPAASFTALIVANLSGVFRVSPANVGVVQASLAVALLPFGVSPGDAVAAGLVLQALQVLPVLLIGVALVGWKGLLGPAPAGVRPVSEAGAA